MSPPDIDVAAGHGRPTSLGAGNSLDPFGGILNGRCDPAAVHTSWPLQPENLPPSSPVLAEDLLKEGAVMTVHSDSTHMDDLGSADRGDATSDEEGEVAQPQRKISERRRLQNAKFDRWFSEKAETVMKEQHKNVIANAPEETLSLRNLVAGHESKAIITSPREYQLELFERAKAQVRILPDLARSLANRFKNTVAVLDTGSGKTLIAVLLLRYILDQELEDRANGNLRRVAFFLVDSVNLVFQQAAVLEANLDSSIDRICGEMGCDLWSKVTWSKHLQNMVIVCTAEVLLQCLQHSFISISEISILIFDEAHHAKKNHAYARIIKDFYLSAGETSRRPRIFGMTASPVDARVDIVQAAQELETLLHCKIATTSDLSLVRRSVSRPKEQLLYYDAPPPHSTTPLFQRLYATFGNVAAFNKLFSFAKWATPQLGPWCSDQIWTFALSEEETRRMEGRLERAFVTQKGNLPIGAFDTDISKLREAREIVEKHVFSKPSATMEDPSSKTLGLQMCLTRVFQGQSTAKCIIFVERRYTARLLSSLFTQIGPVHMRPGILIGARTADAGDVKLSFREQMRVLSRFRKGEVNCLFATSIAEEGLDIPDCNYVIRFDLYKTMIQYIQSRGRARHIESTYIHMIEKGNKEHEMTMREVRLSEQTMRRFCESLPADRHLDGNDIDISDLLVKERSFRVYTDPVTKAKLTYGSSLLVLANFVNSLPYDGETVHDIDFIFSMQDGKFVCEVILPATSPVLSAIGQPAARKATAKQSAAFEACLLLRRGKYLDGHLISTFEKRLPAMRNALLALSTKKMSAYDMRIKPSMWANGWGTCPSMVYMTILRLAQPEALGRPYQPLAILTREPLPDLPQFPLHLDQGISDVCCTSLRSSFGISQQDLDKLTTFTLRIFADISNKVYEHDMKKMSYWIVPIKPAHNHGLEDATLSALLDWAIIDTVVKHVELKWSPGVAHSFFENRFLVDRWDGGRRFYSLHVEKNLKPLDPVPAGTAPAKYNKNILDYSISLWQAARKRATFRTNQPVIRAHKIVHRRNWLDNITENERATPTLCFVCPEPLKISALPCSIAAMGLIFPAIISRLESYLIVLEATRTLELNIRPSLALEALTKDSDNTDDPEEAVQFERGMGANYERLEFIGDCFLKMATSISLFSKYAIDNEFDFHVKRMLMICNMNLLKNAVELRLPEYVRSKGFSRRTWYPEGLKLLQGKGLNKTNTELQKHSLGDKSVADVAEALIGAALVSNRDTGHIDPAVHAVTVLVKNPDHNVHSWAEYFQMYKKPLWSTAPATASQLELCKQLEREDGYHFRFPKLARSAFCHPSYPFRFERVPCYQRLEFLGDALLDMACVNWLFYRYPTKDPQWLTEHKMAMVSNKFLGALCVKLGFNRHLRAKDSMEYAITQYVTEVNEAREDSGWARDYWTHVHSPPKCLPDIVEAYIGAIFVDSGFDYKQVERFFDQHISWFFEDMSIYDTFANAHPTTYLINMLTQTLKCRNFRVIAKEVPSIDGTTQKSIAAVMIHEEIIAEGAAASTKNAKVKASMKALDVLGKMGIEKFRQNMKCVCSPEELEGAEDELVTANVGTAI